VVNFGLFVELDDIHIEGLVHVTALRNDYYHFDDVGLSLTGERTGESFHLGDRVHVQVSRVDMDDHKIDLQLLEVIQRNRTSAPLPQRQRQSRRSTEKGKEKAGFKKGGKDSSKPKTGKSSGKAHKGTIGSSNKRSRKR